ncbi:putative sporulation protein YtxC [Anoxybacillus sp. CHMUD]|uniref:putative sporulation protein YtxC n=1 Tax=Anoxybacillus sp. CHMUD TaxID=2508870 RepID=UPI0014910C5E|nr:putative sporulation protein YtxC [Anoxybacillus sp. CHMUD]NNU90658.1 putative sporulation protein YtxC [Anoxybacillus sp. CHMUD]
MIYIVFQDGQDAQRLFAELSKAPQPYGKLLYDDKTITIFFHEQDVAHMRALFIPIFTSCIIRAFEARWILSIISRTFFYENEEEQQQILQLACSFIEGERYDYRPRKKANISREQLIAQSLHECLHEGLFSFESLMTFRLKPYYDRLMHYVELAIDEYKLEQEYQAFVHMLREIVALRQPQMNALHVLYEHGSFQFFDERFVYLSPQQLKQWIDRRLMVSQPMYIDTSVLAPLVSIAPEKIWIYTDVTDVGMIQTIQNVFQERIELRTPLDFPKKYAYNDIHNE